MKLRRKAIVNAVPGNKKAVNAMATTQQHNNTTTQQHKRSELVFIATHSMVDARTRFPILTTARFEVRRT
jgi:hypothetical protein